jgi:hypothetical protein
MLRAHLFTADSPPLCLISCGAAHGPTPRHRTSGVIEKHEVFYLPALLTALIPLVGHRRGPVASRAQPDEQHHCESTLAAPIQMRLRGIGKRCTSTAAHPARCRSIPRCATAAIALGGRRASAMQLLPPCALGGRRCCQEAPRPLWSSSISSIRSTAVPVSSTNYMLPQPRRRQTTAPRLHKFSLLHLNRSRDTRRQSSSASRHLSSPWMPTAMLPSPSMLRRMVLPEIVSS